MTCLSRKFPRACARWGLLGLSGLCQLFPGHMPGVAWAAESGISIELNRAEDKDKACRLSMVFTNRLKVPVTGFAIEAVTFDKTGSVGRFLVFKSRPLVPGKIRVQQYDLPGTSCGSLGKILLNDVKACKGEGLDAQTCLAHTSLSSRAGIPFVSTVVPKE